MSRTIVDPLRTPIGDGALAALDLRSSGVRVNRVQVIVA